MLNSMNNVLESQTPTHQSRRTALLPVVLLSLALVVAAVPALNVALPHLASDTDATMSQLQWIVDAYALVFAGLLLPAGALGDRYGRKPVLVTGLLLFATGAGLAALTTSPDVLIGLRGLMGVGAALVMPTTLSIITTSFPKEQRGRAVGAWIGVAGAGAVLGLLTSGLLLEVWGWQSVFVFSAAAGLLIAVAAIRLVPNSRDAEPPRVDYVGGLLSVVALSGIVFAAIEGPERGWSDTLTVAASVVGVVGAVLWVVWGLYADEPLLDPRLFARRDFSTGVLSITLQFFVFFGFVFLIVQFVQLGARVLTPAGGVRPDADGDGDGRALAAGPASPVADRSSAPRRRRPAADGDRSGRARPARRGVVVLAAAGGDPADRGRHGPRHGARHDGHRRLSAAEQAGCRVRGQ